MASGALNRLLRIMATYARIDMAGGIAIVVALTAYLALHSS